MMKNLATILKDGTNTSAVKYDDSSNGDNSSNGHVSAFHLNNKVYAFICFLDNGLNVFVPTEVIADSKS